jgi:hypothetical protein
MTQFTHRQFRCSLSDASDGPGYSSVLNLAGSSLNMRKSVIAAIYHATGRTIATDSITFNSVPFTVLPPDAAHKVLGVSMTLTGNYMEPKEYVTAINGNKVFSSGSRGLDSTRGTQRARDYYRHCINILSHRWSRTMDGSRTRWYIKTVDSGLQIGVGIPAKHGQFAHHS